MWLFRKILGSITCLLFLSQTASANDFPQQNFTGNYKLGEPCLSNARASLQNDNFSGETTEDITAENVVITSDGKVLSTFNPTLNLDLQIKNSSAITETKDHVTTSSINSYQNYGYNYIEAGKTTVAISLILLVPLPIYNSQKTKLKRNEDGSIIYTETMPDRTKSFECKLTRSADQSFSQTAKILKNLADNERRNTAIGNLRQSMREKFQNPNTTVAEKEDIRLAFKIVNTDQNGNYLTKIGELPLGRNTLQENRQNADVISIE